MSNDQQRLNQIVQWMQTVGDPWMRDERNTRPQPGSDLAADDAEKPETSPLAHRGIVMALDHLGWLVLPVAQDGHNVGDPLPDIPLDRSRLASLRSRRQPGVWSPLEYGCHLRDMLLVQRERVLAARRMDRPDCPPSGRDERVIHDGYADQQPEDVARQLADAAQLFSNVVARLADDDWDRAVIYHYPETRERSLRWVAVHTLHEAQHHLLDIRRQV